MTIEKITVVNFLAKGEQLIASRLNQVIDVVNSLTGGEKERCTDPRGNQLCTDGINTYHQFNTTEPGYKCPYCNKKAPKKPEPKSNTLREKLGLIAFDGEVEEILSLVKVHLEKEVAKASTPGEYVYTENIKQIIRNL